MALVTLRQLLDDAAEYGYAIPAFNVNNMEQMLAIMKAADHTDSPVIMQASRGARAFAGDETLSHLIRAAIEKYPHIPVCMHQDHGNSPSTCLSAILAGFSSVMMDGSLAEDGRTPLSLEDNVAVTAKVSEMAHLVGVSVEGEIGHLGSLESGRGEAEDGHGFEGELDRTMLLTDPAEAAEFVRLTKVDALAIAIGTSHGAYKFSRKPDGDILSIQRLKEIHARLPNTHLVMHGSSSVPLERQDIINAHGGEVKPTFGVPVEEIQEGIRHGVRKVNVDTDLRMAFTGAIRKVFALHPAEFDPRKYLAPGIEAMAKVCSDRYEQFGAAGHASTITPIPLAEMAKRYAC
ncbi:class II fructose-bisphosphate aldolase [Agrobacterium tumefaciens]|uniref:class II fructose-bisphosphate aldolase n=1 Tax=Agrobacterium tumefaciens TaxID=358 RepID=UPI003BA33A2B